MFLLLNLAIEGGWSGNHRDKPALPADLLVDRVLVEIDHLVVVEPPDRVQC
jgi:hypothetical protein